MRNVKTILGLQESTFTSKFAFHPPTACQPFWRHNQEPKSCTAQVVLPFGSGPRRFHPKQLLTDAPLKVHAVT